MLFEVLTSKDGGSGNAQKYGPNAARIMQTASMHKQLLDPATNPVTANAYLYAMHMPDPVARRNFIAQLEAQAIADERSRPEYWTDDALPRRDIQSSSSWVGNIRYYPPKDGNGTGTAWIQLGDKWYEYPKVSPQGMMNFLTSSSLGKYLNRMKPYQGGDFYLKI